MRSSYLRTLTKYDFKRIIRYGIIYKFELTKISEIKKIIKYFCRDMQENVHQLDLRFSQKYPSIESVAKKTVKDFSNIIFRVIKIPSNEELLFTVDYQEIYQPPLDKPVQKPISDFFHRSEIKIQKSIFPWIESILSSKV